MKILFITSEFFNKTGGGALARTYLKILQDLAGKDNVFPFIFPKRNIPKEEAFEGYITKRHYSKIEKISNIILRRDPLIGKNVEEELIQCIRENNIEIVLLFRSTQGVFIDMIRRFFPVLPVVTVFHDIYPDVIKNRKRENLFKYFSRWPQYFACAKSEQYAVEHSSARIVFNERERKSYLKYYHKEPELILPIIWKDAFDPALVDSTVGEKLYLLFVGQYFGPNVNGLRWFVKNVMPFLDDSVELWVVGRKMEQLREESDFRDRRINIIGSVDSLAEYYYKADIVIAPIFEGTGMKTKTAEALMYGKVILASEEALIGYETVVDALCNNADEYISKINNYVKHHPQKYDERQRKLYEGNYSINNAVNKLKPLFEMLV